MTIEINGLLWDTENTIIGGNEEHLTHQEALDSAEAAGKRLPTKEEWDALIALGSTWDADKRGLWLGNDHALGEKSKHSIFLPAAGFRSYINGARHFVGAFGYYWSSTLNSTTYAYGLSFSDTTVNVSSSSNNVYGDSVRCVTEQPGAKKLEKMNRKIYIAGKIGGESYINCYHKFLNAEKQVLMLKMDYAEYCTLKKYEPVNPMKLCNPAWSWLRCMFVCIKALRKCYAIYLLPDWEASKGARIEHKIAKRRKMKIYYELH